METRTVALNDKFENFGSIGTICQKETAVFIATLIVTFVLGYTPDLSGIFNWFTSFAPLAGAFSWRICNS